jgi:hypothetical protein
MNGPPLQANQARLLDCIAIHSVASFMRCRWFLGWLSPPVGVVGTIVPTTVL